MRSPGRGTRGAQRHFMRALLLLLCVLSGHIQGAVAKYEAHNRATQARLEATKGAGKRERERRGGGKGGGGGGGGGGVWR